MSIRTLFFSLILSLSGAGHAVEVRQFDDPAKESLYYELIDELRCLVCQNQSLADSEAELAKDLRDEVYGIIQSGKSGTEAIKFLTDRYGDFVLYRPPFKATTLFLWVGPFLLLVFGGYFLWRQVRDRNRAATPVDLSADERRRLERLTKQLGD